ncbi:uncharacterized protein F4822DRAFT_428656 [Hypoxylon trugodes]|uniref:uncharacterized protein n=1 Tax=Hypoxylon trugodes TaxID=326681 RepID=UPI00218F9899|nr:uncharacterized protein F4822DRAFT_428656 [Hypoxylon trugodes]KAI1390318.1 hypothetical protein F4822DRAFT_428656 [Hypoxylon trugodes]
MAPAASGSDGLPFIVSTSTKKADPELRKFIRSHVMVGKNRGKTLGPRAKRDKKSKEPDTTTEKSDVTSSMDDIYIENRILLSASLRAIPKRVGTNTSFIQFADTVEQSAINTIMEFSSQAKKAMFPLETCINFGPKDLAYIEALTIDAAYLHAMAFSTQIYFDLRPGRQDRKSSAYMHVAKTLQLLRERLDNAELDISKSWFTTTAVIMCLAFYAHVMGEVQTARHHMQGLRKIVDMKGELSALRGNIKQLLEMFRCDIGIALHSGTKPLFFANPLREPFWPYPLYAGYNTHPLHPIPPSDELFLSTLDPLLSTPWLELRKFSALVNRAHSTGRKMPKDYLLDAMASTTYRLIHKPPSPRGSLDEAVRLGLLAFASTLFLQWVGVRQPQTHFPISYQEALANLEFPDPNPNNSDNENGGDNPKPISPRLLLWLLTVGAVSVFSEVDCATWLNPWLLVNIELCGVRSWSDMQEVLHSFMWVGLLHDVPGKMVYDSAISSSLTLGLQ